MLITFQSKAAANVIMFGETARQLLAVLGKDPGEDNSGNKGIVTVEQLPEALARLQAAIEAARAQQNVKTAAEREAEEEAAREDGRSGMNAPVDLAQRAWPLLDLLQRSQAEGVPVIWGA